MKFENCKVKIYLIQPEDEDVETGDLFRGAVAVEEGEDVYRSADPAFKQTYFDAVRQARAERKIGLFQYWRLMAVSERQLARIQAGVQDEAHRAGMACGGEGFDWNSLLAFIKELLPLILQIISIFNV